MIEEITSADHATATAISTLLGQLTSHPCPFGEGELQRIIADPASHLFVARIEERVAAMLTLGSYLSPTGCKAWIEDVVVDEAFRGRGLGRELVEFAIQYCKTHLALCTLMLTSNPTRVAANELYRSSGFEQKITNVYKLNCPDNE